MAWATAGSTASRRTPKAWWTTARSPLPPHASRTTRRKARRRTCIARCSSVGTRVPRARPPFPVANPSRAPRRRRLPGIRRSPPAQIRPVVRCGAYTPVPLRPEPGNVFPEWFDPHALRQSGVVPTAFLNGLLRAMEITFSSHPSIGSANAVLECSLACRRDGQWQRTRVRIQILRCVARQIGFGDANGDFEPDPSRRIGVSHGRRRYRVRAGAWRGGVQTPGGADCTCSSTIWIPRFSRSRDRSHVRAIRH